MNRIEAMWERLDREGRKGLFIYLTVGDPDLETTGRLVKALVEAGADLVELGLPFSDPLADGPTIQAAAQRSLNGGFRTRQLFQLITDLRREVAVPLVVLSYYNPIFREGTERFATSLAAAGGDGVMVPDLPLEETGELRAALEDRDLHLIDFLAPTSTDDRLAEVGRQARGFIYCVSLTGVTGVRQRLAVDLGPFLDRVRRVTQVPLALGFGISNPHQAREAARHAEAVIVGSAVVDIIEAQGRESAATVTALVAALRRALDENPVDRNRRECYHRA